MTPKTLEKLQYFAGKVCSIVTTSMNRAFDEQISREHFVIIVQNVTTDGVWGTHPYNDDIVSFFRMDHIISIHQEFELDPNDPEHANMIQDFEKKNGQKLKGDLKKPEKVSESLLPILAEMPEAEVIEGDVTFVDIANLEKIAETTQKMYSAYITHESIF